MKSLVTEEPGVESPVDGRVRAIRDKAAGRVEEPGVESPVDGRVRAVREAAEEVEEVVAGGSSIRLLIRV